MTYKKRLEILITDAKIALGNAVKMQDLNLIKTAQAYLNGLEKAYEVLPNLRK